MTPSESLNLVATGFFPKSIQQGSKAVTDLLSNFRTGLLAAPPPPPRDWDSDWRTAKGIVTYFESLSWQNPWLDSNPVMFVLSQLCHDADRHQQLELLKISNLMKLIAHGFGSMQGFQPQFCAINSV